MKRTTRLAPIVLLLLCTSACIHKSSGTVTPWERVHTYNAALAEANDAAERGAEAVVTSNLASAPQMAPFINTCGRVALLHQQITRILAQGSATPANLQGVEQLVDVIKQSIATLPADALGLKNPNSQRTFREDAQNIYALLDAVLSALQATKTGGFLMGAFALTPQLVEEIIALILQIGPLGVDLFVKLEGLLNLGPNEKQNIANAIKASDAADQETIDRVTAWQAANAKKL